MSAQRLPWLIAYDIRSPKRLSRLHRFLCKHAAPVQYSVFLGRYTPEELRWLCDGINAIIHVKQDDVRCYPVPQEPCLTMVGRHRCAEGWSLLAGLHQRPESVPGIGGGARSSRRKGRRQSFDFVEELDPVRSEPTP